MQQKGLTMQLTHKNKLFFFAVLLSLGVFQNLKSMNQSKENSALAKIRFLKDRIQNGSSTQKNVATRALEKIENELYAPALKKLKNDFEDSLFKAIERRNAESVKVLLPLTSPNCIEPRTDHTPLMKAVLAPFIQPPVVEVLLQHPKVEVNKRRPDGCTALHLLVKHHAGQEEHQVAQMLLVAGADPTLPCTASSSGWQTEDEGKVPFELIADDIKKLAFLSYVLPQEVQHIIPVLILLNRVRAEHSFCRFFRNYLIKDVIDEKLALVRECAPKISEDQLRKAIHVGINNALECPTHKGIKSWHGVFGE